MSGRKEVLVVTVPAGKLKVDEFGRFREYIIESILREVLVLDDSISCEIQEMPSVDAVPMVVQEPEKRPSEKPKTKEPEKQTNEEKRLKERELKQNALARLQAYRQKNGVGSFAAVAKKATRAGVSAETLRMALLGEATLTLADWVAVGKALDKLEGKADE